MMMVRTMTTAAPNPRMYSTCKKMRSRVHFIQPRQNFYRPCATFIIHTKRWRKSVNEFTLAAQPGQLWIFSSDVTFVLYDSQSRTQPCLSLSAAVAETRHARSPTRRGYEADFPRPTLSATRFCFSGNWKGSTSCVLQSSFFGAAEMSMQKCCERSSQTRYKERSFTTHIERLS